MAYHNFIKAMNDLYVHNVRYLHDASTVVIYSMNTYVLLHFEHKMTSQSLSKFCIELRADFV